MAAGYDGTIRINTSIDGKGFNQGTNNMVKSAGKLLTMIKGLMAAVGLAFGVSQIVQFAISSIDAFSIISSQYGQMVNNLQYGFLQLQGAMANLALAIVAVLYPVIIQIMTAITQFLSVLAQAVGILFGMAGVLQTVGDKWKYVGKNSGNALASFDKLNVLADKPMLPGLNESADAAKNIQDLKDKVLGFLQPAIDAFDRLKTVLVPLGITIWEGLKWGWDNILVPFGTWVSNDLLPVFLDTLGITGNNLNEALKAIQPYWKWFWENVLKPAADWTGEKIIEGLKWLNERLKDLGNWVHDNPDLFARLVISIGAAVAALFLAPVAIDSFVIAFAALVGVIVYVILNWESLKTTVLQILYIIGWAIWTYLYEPLMNWAGSLVGNLKSAFDNAISTVQSTWGSLVNWFQINITNPIRNAFDSALNGIEAKFRSVFDNIGSIAKGIANLIIDAMNGMMDSMAGGINTIITGANATGSLIPGYVPLEKINVNHIPRLATGAVIPPNASFAAILGDQSSGRNLEAPESLIRQIVREETANQNVSIKFGGSLGELVRLLKPEIDRETVRVGSSMIKSSGLL